MWIQDGAELWWHDLSCYVYFALLHSGGASLQNLGGTMMPACAEDPRFLRGYWGIFPRRKISIFLYRLARSGVSPRPPVAPPLLIHLVIHIFISFHTTDQSNTLEVGCIDHRYHCCSYNHESRTRVRSVVEARRFSACHSRHMAPFKTWGDGTGRNPCDMRIRWFWHLHFDTEDLQEFLRVNFFKNFDFSIRLTPQKTTTSAFH